MLPNHHIDEDMLLAYAAGTLGEAASVLTAAHLSLCPHCRAGVAAAEAVGGALLEDIAPAPVSEINVAAFLDRMDAAEAPTSQKTARGDGLLPAPVSNYMSSDMKSLKWSFVQPGVRFAELLVDGTGARMGLMHTQPGASITPHGHSGEELTLVLSGGYSCNGQGYRRGDLQSADESTTHELTTDLDGECLSLVMIRGRIRPTRWIARILRHFTDF
ncbi:MAG: ChrR family anti-sigma-E factor [Rhodospirillaceae bacterium]|nr:ChrR family anti-sigma-E factor [Rhodospirillaceae bacterium]